MADWFGRLSTAGKASVAVGGAGTTLSPTTLEFAWWTRFVATAVTAADPPR